MSADSAMPKHSGTKKYLSYFRIRFTTGLQYRAAGLAGVVTQFAWGFMLILMYKAFYDADGAAFPMTFEQTVSYVWLQQALLALFMTWFLDNEILDSISDGNVAYELVRPLDLYNMWLTRTLATRLARAALRCFPMLLVAAFLPAPFGLSAPYSVEAFALFLITLTLGFVAISAFCMLVYITTFFTMSPLGIRLVMVMLADFLSGSLIPLPFMPDGVRGVLELLPFAAMQNLPLRIYSGNIAGADALRGIALQVFWVTALILIGRLLMKKALKRVVVQGG